jgi:hypothetical protein
MKSNALPNGVITRAAPQPAFPGGSIASTHACKVTAVQASDHPDQFNALIRRRYSAVNFAFFQISAM